MSVLEKAAEQTLATKSWWETIVHDTRRHERHARASGLFCTAAERYQKEGNHKDAARCMTRAYDVHPNMTVGLRAFFMWSKLSADDAKSILDRVSSSLAADTAGKYYQRLAQSYRDEERWKNAISVYILASKYHQTVDRVVTCLLNAASMTMLHTGEWDRAARIYESMADIPDGEGMCKSLYRAALAWHVHDRDVFERKLLQYMEHSAFLDSPYYQKLARMTTDTWTHPNDV